jgi:DNA-binding transcriptional ArsR family regulator
MTAKATGRNTRATRARRRENGPKVSAAPRPKKAKYKEKNATPNANRKKTKADAQAPARPRAARPPAAGPPGKNAKSLHNTKRIDRKPPAGASSGPSRVDLLRKLPKKPSAGDDVACWVAIASAAGDRWAYAKGEIDMVARGRACGGSGGGGAGRAAGGAGGGAAGGAVLALAARARRVATRGRVERIAETLDAAASPHRLAVLAKLLEGPATYQALQKATGLKVGPLYHHINRLRLARLVAPKERDLYRLTRAGRNLLCVLLASLPLLTDARPMD